MAGEASAVIETRALAKAFGRQRAVDGIDLAVPAGAVYGFLGPNGSGKTTTIRMLMGLLAPTDGQVRMLGEPIPQRAESVLHRVGALIEGPAFYPHLNARANLARFQAVDGTDSPNTARRRADAALERVGLAGAANKTYRSFSLGMKQRLGIAVALLRPREILILDEPMNGLDPQGTREIRQLIADLASAGTTVVISSHLLSEVEHICSHVGIMSRGRLVAQAPLDDLRSQEAELSLTTTEQCVEQAMIVLGQAGIEQVSATGVHITASVDQRPPQQISALLAGAGIDLVAFEVRRPSLEDVFVALTGSGFDVQ